MMPNNIDKYTEIIVKLEYLTNNLSKLDEDIKDISVEQRTTNALISVQREKLINVEKLIEVESKIRKEDDQGIYDYIRENEGNTLNKMKVWFYMIGISTLITIAGFIISFLK